jgi:hypothetical protein
VTLELTDGARARIRELRDLADRAERGEEGARKELRVALRESAPEVIARCSNTARSYRGILAKTASGGDPLVEEAIQERASRLAAEVAGENPSPLEALLSERIASLWVLVELFEALMSAQLSTASGGAKGRVSPALLKHYLAWQDRANSRYLAAMRELARVRKLQANTPGIQFNTQINFTE